MTFYHPEISTILIEDYYCGRSESKIHPYHKLILSLTAIMSFYEILQHIQIHTRETEFLTYENYLNENEGLASTARNIENSYQYKVRHSLFTRTNFRYRGDFIWQIGNRRLKYLLEDLTIGFTEFKNNSTQHLVCLYL